MLYTKGHIPANKGLQVAWNKGLKGLHLSPKTEIKPNAWVGSSHPSWKGGIQKNKNDCVYIYKSKYKRVRRPVAVWEAYRGVVPKGFCVVYKNGLAHDDCIDNLCIISRRDLLKLNRREISL